MKRHMILAAFMLVSGLAILVAGCFLISWYSSGAEKESALLLVIGIANVWGAWKVWRMGTTSNTVMGYSQQIALWLIPVATVYLAGYAFLGIRICGFKDPQNGAAYCGFMYRYRWESRLFMPAAALESLVFQRNVATGTEDELTWTSPLREAKPDAAASGEVRR